jgi:DNA primase
MGEVHAGADKIEFLGRVFGQVDVFTKGNVQVKCPKCIEDHRKLGIPMRKRKLAINILKSDIFHCWFCGYRGRLIHVLKKYSSRELLIEYIKRFADVQTLTVEDDGKPSKKDVKLPRDFRMLATHKDDSDPILRQAHRYAKERGFTERELWYFKVGVSQDDTWRYRLLFPSFDNNGKINYIVGRSWLPNVKYSYWDTEMNKKKIVFNELNIDWKKELTITEGPMDLVKCNDNAIPMLGSDLSRDSLLFAQIVKNDTPILLAMDPDMAYKKMPKVIDTILKAGNKIRVLSFGKYSDVGDMEKQEFMRRRGVAKIWNRMSLLTHKISAINSTFTI